LAKSLHGSHMGDRMKLQHNIDETTEKAFAARRAIGALLRKLIKGISHPYSAFILFCFLMFGLFNMVSMQAGDDQFYAGMHLNYGFLEFITLRYQTWSGRIFCDALSYYFIGPAQFLWKWICAGSITISALLIYKFVILGREMGGSEKRAFAYLSCFSEMLISSTILNSSVFWITGALGYLVPFTFGLVAFVPFFYALKKVDYSPGRWTFLFVVPAILTALGGEQISLCFLSFSLLILIFRLAQKRRVPPVLWFIFIASFIFEIISLTAPGNSKRFINETATWFPAFQQIVGFKKIPLSLHFLFNTILNQWYLLIFLLLIITAVLLLKNRPSGFSRIIVNISFFLAFLLGLRFIQPLDTDISQESLIYFNRLFEFNYLTKASLFVQGNFVSYAVWSIAIVIIPLSLLLIFKKTAHSFFYIAIYLAAMASITLMIFSPTLYASGGRTSFPSNMLLILLILFLLRHADLVKGFALPIMMVALMRLFMYYSSWSIAGYQLTYGVLNTQGLPFLVLGY
jgi:hypothetical protein